MLTICRDDLPNPHKNCIRGILNMLVCHENDIRRINVELRNIQIEFKNEMQKIEARCNEIRQNPACSDAIEPPEEFIIQVTLLDELNACYTGKIENFQKEREGIFTKAKECYNHLNTEKCYLKKFHENTIDYLKRHANKTDDLKIKRNCEKDIREMLKLYNAEIAFIKRCENELEPFLKQISDTQNETYCNCCCFKEYDWLPKPKNLEAVDVAAEEIKTVMGTTLKRAFAQMCVHRPPDQKAFLAGYFMNVEQNEDILKEKLNLFGSV